MDIDAQHPLLLADIAVHAVQDHRETIEQQLAGSWANEGQGMLYMDGGISGDATVAAAANIVGVVKTHRVLYGDAAAMRTIVSLAQGERSSVFTIGSPERRRSPVASFYLRIRDSLVRTRYGEWFESSWRRP